MIYNAMTSLSKILGITVALASHTGMCTTNASLHTYTSNPAHNPS